MTVLQLTRLYAENGTLTSDPVWVNAEAIAYFDTGILCGAPVTVLHFLHQGPQPLDFVVDVTPSQLAKMLTRGVPPPATESE